MRTCILLVMLFIVGGCAVSAKSIVDRNANIYSPNNEEICLLEGAPPTDIEYEAIGRVVATKRSYGSEEELFPEMAYEAKKIGADAIVNVKSSQRFKGPLPWRIVAPTGDGRAIKILDGSPELDCMHAGGRVY